MFPLYHSFFSPFSNFSCVNISSGCREINSLLPVAVYEADQRGIWRYITHKLIKKCNGVKNQTVTDRTCHSNNQSLVIGNISVARLEHLTHPSVRQK